MCNSGWDNEESEVEGYRNCEIGKADSWWMNNKHIYKT